MRCNRAQQKIINTEEIEEYLTQGYESRAVLPDEWADYEVEVLNMDDMNEESIRDTEEIIYRLIDMSSEEEYLFIKKFFTKYVDIEGGNSIVWGFEKVFLAMAGRGMVEMDDFYRFAVIMVILYPGHILPPPGAMKFYGDIEKIHKQYK